MLLLCLRSTPRPLDISPLTNQPSPPTIRTNDPAGTDRPGPSSGTGSPVPSFLGHEPVREGPHEAKVDMDECPEAKSAADNGKLLRFRRAARTAHFRYKKLGLSYGRCRIHPAPAGEFVKAISDTARREIRVFSATKYFSTATISLAAQLRKERHSRGHLASDARWPVPITRRGSNATAPPASSATDPSPCNTAPRTPATPPPGTW